MSVALAPTTPVDIGPTFISQLNSELEAWKSSYKDQLEHAIHVGGMLLTAKSQLKHGEWKDWLATNFTGSDRTARVATQLATAYNQDERSIARAEAMPQSIQAALNQIRRNKTGAGSVAAVGMAALNRSAGTDEQIVDAEVVGDAQEDAGDLQNLASQLEQIGVRVAEYNDPHGKRIARTVNSLRTIAADLAPAIAA